MKKLEPTLSLYAVEVPLDAEDIELHEEDENNVYITYHTGMGSDGYDILMETIPKGEFELLGEVTKDTISFDPENYVENLFRSEAWKDYRILENKGWGSYPLLTAKESFYSLLAANGKHFVNPKGRRQDIFMPQGRTITFSDMLAEWQSYEDNLIKKAVILNKVK